MEEYYNAFLGGALIGVATSILLLFKGRIFGISGIIAGILKPQKNDWLWRVCILLGLLAGGLLTYWYFPQQFGSKSISNTRAIIAGVCVGFGTQLGNGCTSGHGICGLSRFSYRSFIAALSFMTSGFLTVFLFGAL
jgi:uncharacterized membrane protein YedE/YeeE